MAVLLQVWLLLLQVAKSWGCHCVVLHCDPRNLAAYRMYQQGGFRRVSKEPIVLQFLEGRPGRRLELMIKRL